MSQARFPDRSASCAVLIGASKYESSSLHPIPAVSTGVSALHAALTDTRYGVIDVPNCHALSDPATADEIGEALSRAAEQAEDLLLVYYSGHGLLDDGGALHLALPATRPQRPGWTGIPLELLKSELAGARARARVLILDCCFSGRAVASMADPDGLVLGQLWSSGTYVLTSTSATAPSHAPLGERYTSFTSALLDALGAPDPLSLDGIYDHVRAELAGRGYPRPRRQAVDDIADLALARGPVSLTEQPEGPASDDAVVFSGSGRRMSRRQGRVTGAAGSALMVGSVVWGVLYPSVLGDGFWPLALTIFFAGWFLTAYPSSAREAEQLVIDRRGLTIELFFYGEPFGTIHLAWTNIEYLGLLNGSLIVRPRGSAPLSTIPARRTGGPFWGRPGQKFGHANLTSLPSMQADRLALRDAVGRFGGPLYRTEQELLDIDPLLGRIPTSVSPT